MPIKIIIVPRDPKKCIGLFPNLFINQSVIMSKNPLINLSLPNFVLPYFLAWCLTMCSPILLYPSFFAKIGINLCISPYTSIDFITSDLKTLIPQLKSWILIPELHLATKLNNFEGIFFKIKES